MIIHSDSTQEYLELSLVKHFYKINITFSLDWFLETVKVMVIMITGAMNIVLRGNCSR